jgi:CheY-specific phosphatase CheX
MAVKFFGQYLVEKGLISREQLLAALDLQKATNLKFGEMAQKLGLLSEDQILRVHNAQHSDDQRFGDIAVRIGLLTEEQVQEVLVRQQDTYIYLGAALVQVGALDAEALASHLQAFKLDQEPYVVEAIEIPAGIPHPRVWEAAADLTYKMLTRLANLPYRKEQCTLISQLEPNDVIARMELSGSLEATCLLSVSSGVRAAIARTMLREEVENGPQELLDDAVMEFVNVVCGNLAAKAAQFGEKINLAPPEAIHPGSDPLPVPVGRTGLLFPIHVVNGEEVALALFVAP